MAESNAKTKNKSISEWWEGIKDEFRKIVWADAPTVGRQTSATVIVSVVLALLIVLFDMLIKFGFEKVIKL